MSIPSVLAITQYLTGIDCGLRVDEPNLDLLNELDIDLSRYCKPMNPRMK